jgi:hypothetical protein
LKAWIDVLLDGSLKRLNDQRLGLNHRSIDGLIAGLIDGLD